MTVPESLGVVQKGLGRGELLSLFHARYALEDVKAQPGHGLKATDFR